MVMSEDVSQVGVALTKFLTFQLSRFSFYTNNKAFITLASVLIQNFPQNLLYLFTILQICHCTINRTSICEQEYNVKNKLAPDTGEQ